MVIYSDDIRASRMLAIILSFTIILAPVFIPYIFILSNPTDVIRGNVTNKRVVTGTYGGGLGGFGTVFYVTIGAKELLVSREIYKKLSVNDYISASFRKKTLYYYTVI